MDSFWNHCLRNFEKSLPAQQYKTWIQPLHARLDQHTVVVSAPNRFVLEWVKDKFVPEIERLSSEYTDNVAPDGRWLRDSISFKKAGRSMEIVMT